MVIHSFPYGRPALNLHAPCGAAGGAGLPIGMQLIGRAFGDRELLGLAAGFEAL